MNNAVLIADRAYDHDSRRLAAPGAYEVSASSATVRLVTVVLVSLVGIVVLGLLWWFDPARVGLPLCTFRTMTGLNCPGCGATRATHELLHGHWAAAWRLNALWAVSWPAALYAVVSELRTLSGRRPLPGDLPRQPWFWVSLAVAAVVFFFVRNLHWLGA